MGGSGGERERCMEGEGDEDSFGVWREKGMKIALVYGGRRG